ncbi:hypothetical protein LCGC14_2402620, partial [marine sediment metagenome]
MQGGAHIPATVQLRERLDEISGTRAANRRARRELVAQVGPQPVYVTLASECASVG